MKTLNGIKLVVIGASVAIATNSFASEAGQTPQIPKREKLEEEIDSTFNRIPYYVNEADSTVLSTIGMTRENTDSAEFAKMPWLKQLYKSGFNINTPGINYPKFPRFIVNTYNWADKFFNGFDTEYVKGTGYDFKAYLKSYNWMQNYGLYFSKNNYTRIRSKMYSDLGPVLSYKAVSIGYLADVSQFRKGKKVNRKNFDIDFTCALFSANLNIAETKGATKITHFGDYSVKEGSYDFDGVYEKSTNFTAYYFFNHKKYSQGAAYKLSRYQYKSSGSWILGFNANHQRIDLDFSTVPESLIEHMPGLEPYYSFRYNSFNIVGGYGYNWVLRPHTWLINVTALPMAGVLHSFEGTTEGKKDLFSLEGQLMSSIVYNHRAFFATAQLNLQGNFMLSKGYTFFDSMTSFAILVGARF